LSSTKAIISSLQQFHPTQVTLFLYAVSSLLILHPLPSIETLSPLLPALLSLLDEVHSTDCAEVIRVLKLLALLGQEMIVEMLADQTLLPNLFALLRDRTSYEGSVRNAVDLLEVLFDETDSSTQPLLAEEIFSVISSLLSSPDKRSLYTPACSRCLSKLLSRLTSETLHALLSLPHALLLRLVNHMDKDTIDLILCIVKHSSATEKSVMVTQGALTYLVKAVTSILQSADNDPSTRTISILETVLLLIRSHSAHEGAVTISSELTLQLQCSLAAASREKETKISQLIEEILATL
jgi:hypothetical protein